MIHHLYSHVSNVLANVSAEINCFANYFSQKIAEISNFNIFFLDHWQCTRESLIPEKLALSLLFCGEDCKEVSHYF